MGRGKIIRRIAIVAAIMLMGLSFMGCGTSTQPVSSSEVTTSTSVKVDVVKFRLNYTAQGSHAPVFYGIDQKIFEKHGISLEVGEGKGSGSTVTIIASKGDTIGYADAGQHLIL